MAQEEARERSASQATSADSDYSEPRSEGDPDSRRSSVAKLSLGDLRKYLDDERKEHQEDRRLLRKQLDRAEEARVSAEEARVSAEEARVSAEEARMRAEARMRSA